MIRLFSLLAVFVVVMHGQAWAPPPEDIDLRVRPGGNATIKVGFFGNLRLGWGWIMFRPLSQASHRLIRIASKSLQAREVKEGCGGVRVNRN